MTTERLEKAARELLSAMAVGATGPRIRKQWAIDELRNAICEIDGQPELKRPARERTGRDYPGGYVCTCDSTKSLNCEVHGAG